MQIKCPEILSQFWERECGTNNVTKFRYLIVTTKIYLEENKCKLSESFSEILRRI